MTAALQMHWMPEYIYHTIYMWMIGKCPKNLYAKIPDKMTYANSADSDQEQSDQSLHYLLHVFH